MIDEKNAENRVYIVLINDEEQYSLWPRSQDIPLGWRSIEFSGTKDECMKHVDELWTDMRPKSLRERMAAAA